MVDIGGYTLTFSDEFDTRSISQNGDQTRWASIRSEWRLDAHSDLGFGASSFVDASSGYDPFHVLDGVLTITASPDTTPYGAPGNWESGLITTQGNFSQTYGYFEMRADLSDHPRAWDAFWLLPDVQAPNPENRPGWQELDIIEHYGNHNIGAYSWIHTTDPHSDPAAELQVYAEHASQISGFHTYGMLWTATTITFYYDGVEVGSKPTPSDMHGPMYILANLAVQQGYGGDDQTMDMKIDYIRVYAAKDSTTPDPDATPVGSDELIVTVGQDYYYGDAEFVVRIDGQQIGSVQKAGSGSITLKGDFGEAPREIAIEFVNDLYHGSTTTDRNLYVEQIVYNGKVYMAAAAQISGGSMIDDRVFLHSTGSTATFALSTYSGEASIAAGAAHLTEGSSGSTVFTFNVTLSAPSDDSQSLQWGVAYGSGATAASADDFAGPTSGAIAFAPGQTSATIQVFVTGDTIAESDESFSVVLSNPSSGLNLGLASADGLIINDDGLTLNGTSAANTLTGGALSDFLYGWGGNDTLYGLEGADWLEGGAGADKLYGGLGDDVLDGGAGGDLLDGGEGTDTASYVTALAGVIADLASPTVNRGDAYLDKYVSIENLAGSNFADTLRGNASNNVLWGNSGADKLYGLAGNDTLNGGEGDDVLYGGAGADHLWGGAGADVFVFEALGNSSTAAPDSILDFQSGVDKIDLRRIDANTGVKYDQPFSFIGSSAFTGKAGELNFINGALAGDVNGDKIADFQIYIAGISDLSATDLYL
jgi:Ca2+-binding RTX toxin-like protein